MRLFFEEILRIPYKFFTIPNYRKYLLYLIKYGSNKRYSETTISFFKSKITIPDCRSFIPQFEDIFVEKNYKFNTDSKYPIIIDCGANVGLSSMFFHNEFPNAKIYAFEADPKIFRYLENNISKCNCSNVKVFNQAVWIEDGKVNLSSEGADSGSIVYNEKSISVKSFRFSDYLEKFDKIDMLKMDIEGAEFDVLMDCSNQLSRIQNIFIEFHSHIKDEQKLSNILDLLEKNGFRYFIKAGMKRNQPLLNFEKISNSGFDLMLNIYAKKKN